MQLKETVSMMESVDYKERFKAEYLQLEIRVNSLRNMLKKYKDGTLSFKPSCSYDLLNGQLKAMELYATYLDERAEIEGIDLQFTNHYIKKEIEIYVSNNRESKDSLIFKR